MTTPTSPADSGLVSLKNAIESFLTLPNSAGETDKAQWKTGRDQISKELEASRSIQHALDVVLQNGGTNANALLLNRVQFFCDIYRVTENSPQFTEYICKRKPDRFTDIARALYHTPEAPSTISQENIDSFRSFLFQKEPTAVLLGLIERGNIKVATAAKASVVEILASAMKDGFDISQDSTRLLLQQTKFPVDLSLKNRTLVGEVIKSIQRLQALVRDPQHVGLLILAEYDSAKAIANEELDTFQKNMAKKKMAKDMSTRIHDHASTIQVRNEQTWALALSERNNYILPRAVVDAAHGKPDLDDDDQSLSAKKRINMTTLFQDMDTVACTECSSVLSPSAYFVDLLRLLQETKSVKTEEKVSTPTLFAKLIERRPDIQHLQLSCANTNSLVPYLDLVTEILESFIANLSSTQNIKGPDSVQSFDAPTVDADGSCTSQPRNTNFDVYNRVVAKEVFPLETFPYSLSLHTIRELLSATGTSLYDILTTFASGDRVMSTSKPLEEKLWNHGDTELLRPIVGKIIDRCISAEYLGLNQEDYMAICRESFQPPEYWQARNKHASGTISQENYRKDMGVNSAAQLWGYTPGEKTTATQIMLDETDGDGLTFLNLQLLWRAGVSVQDLQNILKTQFMGRRLIITTIRVSTDGAKPVFTGKLSDMRLRLSVLGDKKSSTLTEDICHELQAFIRLWRKLKGWSIADLDTILSTLKRLRNDPAEGISVTMIEDIAAAKRLADTTKVLPAELQVLWGDIDTNGAQSLYAKVFLAPRVSRLDSIFEADAKGHFLQSRENITQHHATLLSTLQVLETDFQAILSASTTVDDNGSLKALNGESVLDIASLSLLYRTSLICKILNIHPSQLKDFRGLFPELDIFGSPRMTLAAVERWKMLRNVGWTAEDIIAIVQTDADGRTEEMALAACSKIASAKLDIEHKDETARNDDVQGDLELKRILPLLFDASSGVNLSRLFEGNLVTKAEITFGKALQKKVDIPKTVAAKLSCILSEEGKKGHITLTGVLSEDELAVMLNIMSQDSTWTVTIRDLHQKSRPVFDLVCRQLQLDEKGIKEAETSFLSTEETAVQLRKTFFLKKALPLVNAQLLRQIVMDSVAVSFPIAAAPLTALVGDILRYTPAVGSKDISAFEALRSIKLHDARAGSFDGFFCPPASGKFKFIVDSGLAVEPELSLSGTTLKFNKTFDVWESEQWGSRLISGKYYPFSYKGNVEKQVKYLTQDSLTPSGLTPDMFVSKESKDVAVAIYQKLATASKVVLRENLGLEEVEYFSQSSKIDFNNITLKALERVHAFRQVVKDTTKEENTFSLVEFLKWASSPGALPKELTSKIASATGWPAKQVENILAAKYPGKSARDKLKLFQDDKELCSLNKIVKLVNRVNLSTVAVVDFFRIGTPNDSSVVMEKIEQAKAKAKAKAQKAATADSGLKEEKGVPATIPDQMAEIAASLRLATQSFALNATVSSGVAEANDRLREMRRTVLIQYLLNHQKIKADLDIHDADGLFEHFLIDVKMGAKLQTSRMRQAISTVQLFVQRCSLGLEMAKIPEDKTKKPPVPAKEVKCSSVSSVRWKYMSKFTLWAANRKLFLYPENWVDPTIRDNKTEPFKALEGALAQSNLSQDTINSAIKTYIYQVNEVADLEVLSYVRQQIDTVASRFHFFAKTRQTPFQYYYRSADIRSEKSSDIRWAPWTKIEVEIPIIETDIDGNPLEVQGSYVVPAVSRGRVYLFIPQFMAKNRPQPPSSTVFNDLAKKSPNEVASKKVWELKLGWTEYRNGKWTPKQTSQASLQFPNINAPFVPPLSSLRFFVSGSSSKGSTVPSEYDTLYIDVQSWYRKTPGKAEETPSEYVTANRSDPGYVAAKQWSLGRFRIRGNRIEAIAPKFEGKLWRSPPTTTMDLDQKPMVIKDADESVPTTFSKLWAKSIEKETDILIEGKVTKVKVHTQQDSEPSIQQGSDKYLLLLARYGINSNNEQDYTWTASFDQTRYIAPSALVLQVADRSKTDTYFAIPAADAGKTTSSTLHLFNHPNMGDIMERCTVHDEVESVYRYLSTLSDITIQDNVFGKVENEYHEQSTPYSLYTWELCMHSVSLLMERYASTQQYDLALDVARLVFDPSADANDDRSVTRCWQFLPFKKIPATMSISGILGSLRPQQPGESSAIGKKVEEWKDNPFNPHSIARGRPNVYMKRFVMKYIEILIASGDAYFRQNSLESIPLAIQRYVEASHLYGPLGKTVPKMGKLPVKTFDELSIYIDAFSNAVVDMELDFPYSCEPCYRGAVNESLVFNPENPPSNKYAGLVQTGYFCLPPNVKLMEIRNLIDDRLFKIRNSMDINGNAISLALFDQPLDPAVLAMAEAANLSPSVLLSDLDSPMPNYRFHYLLQKATEMCTELKTLGDQFLSAKEKNDAETLAMLLSRNEVLSNTTQLSIRDLQKTEALKSIGALEEARKGSVMKLSFYLALTGESTDKVPGEQSQWSEIPQAIEKPTSDDLRMTSYEKQEMEKSDSAAELSEKASTLELAAGALMAIPNLIINMQPMGVGAGIKMDAENIGKLLQCTASALNLKGQMDLHDAQRASRKGAMIRQLQERRLQANIAGWEIKKIDKDIAVQRVRLAMAESEIRAQQQQVERLQEVQEWHRTKYTNSTLYAWLEISFRNLHHKTFLLAMQLARKAERAFQFEMASRIGGTNISFLAPGGYWDSARDGLLSANNLLLGLKRLESAYMEKRPHDYEITKNISLRQVDPTALFSLRQTGKASFALREVLFDMDFPGHYFRRIKSIGISMPAIVGPYTGLNCILSLDEHRVRVKATTASSSDSYTYQGRDDSRFQSDNIPISSIAISSGASDSGTFELSFSGERYLPFEGAGLISKWKLEFPASYTQFDHNTIADVILHVRYTAVEGGLPMRQAANTAVTDYLGAVETSETSFIGPTSILDLKNDFPNEWYNMIDGPAEANTLDLKNLEERLPFFTKGRNVKLQGAVLFVRYKKPPLEATVKLVKPKDCALTKDTRPATKISDDVGVFYNHEMKDVSITTEWRLQVDSKENVENIIVLLEYSLS